MPEQKNIARLGVKVEVDLHETVLRLPKLTEAIRELSDLVPAWNRTEAARLEKEIESHLHELIRGTHKS